MSDNYWMAKMKALIPFLLSAFTAHASTNVTLWSGTNSTCTIPAGCSGKVVSFNAYIQNGFYAGASVLIAVPSATNAVASMTIDYAQYVTNRHSPVIAGPATLSVYGYLANAMATVEISCSDESYTPSAGVVIPSDATGPVNIIMESSADMVNWTMANPGTYGSSATNRFFRVRAIRN